MAQTIDLMYREVMADRPGRMLLSRARSCRATPG